MQLHGRNVALTHLELQQAPWHSWHEDLLACDWLPLEVYGLDYKSPRLLLIGL
jgi:hypothetical protein